MAVWAFPKDCSRILRPSGLRRDRRSARPMKILLASSEAHPYSKTGGLADMVGALARTLARLGHQVGLVTPLYSGIRERFPQLKRLDLPLDLALGSQRIPGEVWSLEPSDRLTIYFIDQ